MGLNKSMSSHVDLLGMSNPNVMYMIDKINQFVFCDLEQRIFQNFQFVAQGMAYE